MIRILSASFSLKPSGEKIQIKSCPIVKITVCIMINIRILDPDALALNTQQDVIDAVQPNPRMYEIEKAIHVSRNMDINMKTEYEMTVLVKPVTRNRLPELEDQIMFLETFT